MTVQSPAFWRFLFFSSKGLGHIPDCATLRFFKYWGTVLLSFIHSPSPCCSRLLFNVQSRDTRVTSEAQSPLEGVACLEIHENPMNEHGSQTFSSSLLTDVRVVNMRLIHCCLTSHSIRLCHSGFPLSHVILRQMKESILLLTFLSSWYRHLESKDAPYTMEEKKSGTVRAFK